MHPCRCSICCEPGIESRHDRHVPALWRAGNAGSFDTDRGDHGMVSRRRFRKDISRRVGWRCELSEEPQRSASPGQDDPHRRRFASDSCGFHKSRRVGARCRDRSGRRQCDPCRRSPHCHRACQTICRGCKTSPPLLEQQDPRSRRFGLSSDKCQKCVGKGPEPPIKVPGSPIKVPKSPNKVPKSPNKVPKSPNKVPKSPNKVPKSPIKVPESPNKLPKSPIKVLESPNKVPESPGKSRNELKWSQSALIQHSRWLACST